MVDLPLPVRPTKKTNSPFSTVKLTSVRARTYFPYSTQTPLNSMFATPAKDPRVPRRAIRFAISQRRPHCNHDA